MTGEAYRLTVIILHGERIGCTILFPSFSLHPIAPPIFWEMVHLCACASYEILTSGWKVKSPEWKAVSRMESASRMNNPENGKYILWCQIGVMDVSHWPVTEIIHIYHIFMAM